MRCLSLKYLGHCLPFEIRQHFEGVSIEIGKTDHPHIVVVFQREMDPSRLKIPCQVESEVEVVGVWCSVQVDVFMKSDNLIFAAFLVLKQNGKDLFILGY